MNETKDYANTLGRLNESLFAELERIEAVDAGDADALRVVEGHPWAADAKYDDKEETK